MKYLENIFSDERKNILFLIGIWGGIMLLVNPIGDFPLNDDWSYAKPVHSLLNGKGIKFTGWMSMTLFAQVLWGALWCKIFGFSFTVLRFSTLFIALFGIIYTYKLFGEFIKHKSSAFILTLLILFNPIFVNLSFTYMTDIPFYSLSIISIYNYIHYLKEGDKKYIIVGLLFSIITILIRQLGLVIPFAFFIIGVMKYIQQKRYEVVYIIPLILSVIVYGVYQYIAHLFFDARGRYDEMNLILFNQVTQYPLKWLIGVFNRNTIGLLYIILFTIPFIISFFIYSAKKTALISVVFGVFFFLFLKTKGYVFPILDNIIYDFGLGPATLYDFWMFPRDNPSFLWIILTLLVSILFIYSIYTVVKKIKSIPEKLNDKTIFILLNMVIYLVLVASISTYDRYYILPIPLFIIFMLNFIEKKRHNIILLILLLPISFYSIAGTHDYLLWNRARWECIDYLLKEKRVDFTDVDGGFEYNGSLNYNDEDFKNRLKNLWVHDVHYIITFTKPEATELIVEKTFFSWLHFKERKVMAVKKNKDFKEIEDPYF